MILLKTAAGQQAFKERHGALSLRQRSAFLLFDGQRSLAQVLEATAALGISWDDVRNMVDAGLLELAEAGPAARNPGSAKPPVPPVAMSGGVGSERSTSERYQAGYLIATELTAALGLRGFRLHGGCDRLRVAGGPGAQDPRGRGRGQMRAPGACIVWLTVLRPMRRRHLLPALRRRHA